MLALTTDARRRPSLAVPVTVVTIFASVRAGDNVGSVVRLYIKPKYTFLVVPQKQVYSAESFTKKTVTLQLRCLASPFLYRNYSLHRLSWYCVYVVSAP